MSTGGVEWVYCYLERVAFRNTCTFFWVDFDRTRKRGRYREMGSTNKRNTTQGEEGRGVDQSKKRSFEGVG